MNSRMDTDDFAVDFIRRLDAGQFDGRVIEVAGKLNDEQLASVHRRLHEREGAIYNVMSRNLVRDGSVVPVGICLLRPIRPS